MILRPRLRVRHTPWRHLGEIHTVLIGQKALVGFHTCFALGYVVYQEDNILLPNMNLLNLKILFELQLYSQRIVLDDPSNLCVYGYPRYSVLP